MKSISILKHNLMRAAMTLALIVTCATAWAQDLTINSTDDWNTFATNVNDGTSYSGQTVALATDISVSTMAGSSQTNSFKGTFYGGGHTLTFNATATADNCAPFGYIDGATFKYLNVAGSISTGYKYAAGIAAHSYGSCTIQSCRSSIAVTTSISGDGTHAGFVAVHENGTLNITDCLFDGSITGSSTTNCGGLVGWRSGTTLTFNNCLMAGTMAISQTNGSALFNRNGGSTLSNCYYDGNKSYGSIATQGATATTATGSDLQALLGSGWEVSGNGVVPIMDTHNLAIASLDGIMSFYPYTGDEIDIVYTVTAADGTALTKGMHYTETFSPSPVLEKGEYTLTISGIGSYTGSYTFRFFVGDDILVTSSTTTMTTGTYAVAGDVTIDSRITVSGNVHLMLYDGCTMNATKGIQVSSGNSLTIDAQSTGSNMGKLIATANTSYYAGIGGSNIPSEGGTITINGGEITASGGNYATGIGGGREGAGGIITINGGKVTASGGNWGAGIGGSLSGGGGNITINGGKVTASGGNWGAGIGAGSAGSAGTITINGGTVIANGGQRANGIGNGTNGSGGTIQLSNTNDENSIYASSYGAATMSIAPGKAFTDGNGHFYTSKTPSSTLLGITGKTLTPANFTQSGDEYTIYTAAGWDVFCDMLESGESFSGKTVKLGQDIEVSRMAGSSDHRFGGTFNGQGNTLTFTLSTDYGHIAPFRYVQGTSDNHAIITNLNVISTIIVNGDRHLSGLISHQSGHVDVTNCNAEVNLSCTKSTTDHELYPAGLVSQAAADNNGTLTISGCTVTGTITTNGKYAAGLVGVVQNATSITNCVSSVIINSSVDITGDKDGTHGGFVAIAYSGTTTITGCLFNGKLLTTNSTTNCGGFVGWRYNSDLTISNCLYAPATIEEGETEIGGADNDESQTFSRHLEGTPTNCYYTRTLHNAQGKLRHSIAAGENVTSVANAGTPEIVYSVSGITSYGTGIKYNNVLYAGDGDNVILTLTNTAGEPPTGYQLNYIANNGGTITSSGNSYSLAMPNNDVTISTTISAIPWTGNGTSTEPYLIMYPSQLDLLAYRVNGTHGYAAEADGFSGKYFKLNNDIEYSYTSDWNQTSSNESNYEAIGYYGGSSEDRPFKGDFDGNNKTVSGIRIYKSGNGNTDQYQGLFGQAVDANIHDLTLADARITGYKNSGGIVGSNHGTVTRCQVEADVAIHAVQNVASALGGIAGRNYYGCTISHCTSAATISIAADADWYYGGIVGVNGQGTLSDNFVVGATIPAAADNRHGAICGLNNSGTLTRNYYNACTVAGVENATGVGCGYISDGNGGYAPSDVTTNDGAIPVFSLTLNNGLTTTTDATVSYNETNYFKNDVTVTVDANNVTIPESYTFIGITVTPNTVTVTDNHDGTYSFTMPAADVTVNAMIIGPVTYLDENGEEQTKQPSEYTLLTGNETTLGTEGQETWYVVDGTINFNQTINVYGHVHIILKDEAVMNVGTESDPVEGSGIYVTEGSISIYGQSTGADKGQLNIYAVVGISTYYGDVTINGGQVTATGNNSSGISTSIGDVTINGGQVTATGDVFGIYAFDGAVTINGGQVSATGDLFGIYAQENNSNITLGWTTPADYIYVNRYNADGTLTLTGTFIDEDGNTYSGTIEQVNGAYSINGKTLYPYVEGSVAYLDMNGQRQMRLAGQYTPLTNSMTTLGTADTETWYVVGDTINFTNTISSVGDVHLILKDGAIVNVGTENSPVDDEGIVIQESTVSIYGQSTGENKGRLNVYANEHGIAAYTASLTINGGQVTATGDHAAIYTNHSDLTINGGQVTATGINSAINVEYGDVTINGGQVTATGSNLGIEASYGSVTISGGQVTATGEASGIRAQNNITLGWTKSSDFILVNSYVFYTDGTLTLAKNFIDEDGNTYSGTIEQVNEAYSIDGKTLYPEGVIFKEVAGYGEGTGGWVFIASPVAESIAPTEVHNLLGSYDEATGKYDYDLYRFNQSADLEWQNYHSHTDDFNLVNGQGYLYATKTTKKLAFGGTPYSGQGWVDLIYSTDNEDPNMRGWNLIGNPFADTAYIDRDFYVMNTEGSEIIAAERTNNYVEAMEGIFVHAEANGDRVTFTTEAPSKGRGPKPEPEQVVINLSNNGGSVIDRAIVNFGQGGLLPKFQLDPNHTKVYIPQDGKDYAIVSVDNAGEIPVNFKAHENGTYTLTVSSTLNSKLSTLNSQLSTLNYLHLIDNMTGADVDLLSAGDCGSSPANALHSTELMTAEGRSYTFTAKTTDYESRFKLVFVANNEDGASTGSETFAFINNGNIIVNGEGTNVAGD